MRLYVFLQILRAFERLATELASMRLQWHMDTNVRGDVVAFDDRDVAISPSAFEIEIVGALATDVSLADMILDAVSPECKRW